MMVACREALCRPLQVSLAHDLCFSCRSYQAQCHHKQSKCCQQLPCPVIRAQDIVQATCCCTTQLHNFAMRLSVKTCSRLISFAKMPSAGQYNEQLFVGFDKVIAALPKYNIKVMPILTGRKCRLPHLACHGCASTINNCSKTWHHGDESWL